MLCGWGYAELCSCAVAPEWLSVWNYPLSLLKFFLGDYIANFHDAGSESGKTEFGYSLCNTRLFNLLGGRDCFAFDGHGKHPLLDECYYVRVLRVDFGLYLEGSENGKSLRKYKTCV